VYIRAVSEGLLHPVPLGEPQGREIGSRNVQKYGGAHIYGTCQSRKERFCHRFIFRKEGAYLETEATSAQ